MRERDALPASSQRGMTLIELMIAMLLGLFIIGGVLGIFIASSETNRRTDDLARIQENARAAIQFMAHSMREAGGTPCGLPPGKGLILHASTTPSSWYTGGDDFKDSLLGYAGGAGFPYAGGAPPVSGSDAVVTVSAVTNITPVTEDRPPNQGMDIPTTENFRQNDILLACSNIKGYGVIFRAGSVTPASGAGTVQRATNFTGPVEFMKMTTLGKLNAEAWFVGNNSRGGTSLFRQYYEGGSGVKLEELVPDVSSMSISYLLQGKEQYERANRISSSDWVNITAVYIELTITRQTANTAIQPISRTVGITVKLRNRNSS